MPARFFEDFQLGESWESPPTPVSADEIVAYARDFDPQPMHTDAARAASGPFKTLVASGWHIASLAMREFVRAGGYGETPMVGLGIDELRWQAPVRAGDVLTVPVKSSSCDARPPTRRKASCAPVSPCNDRTAPWPCP